MKKENAYDFRKKLLTIHEKDIRDFKKQKNENEFMLPDNVRIKVSEVCKEVTKTAVADFTDFLKVSMGIDAKECNAKDAEIYVSLASDENIDLDDCAVYRGFMVSADSNGIKVYGHDERGITQALYYLEDIFTFAKAPVISFGDMKKRPMYSPQMVHSGYGLDEYPDEYLARVAHEGRDTILLFVEDVDKTPCGYVDFNDLIKRAARFGLDVYAYSYYASEMNPLDDGAEEHYDSTYGKLFRECPGLKGVILVGESIGFPSNDPHVCSGNDINETGDDEGLPTGKVPPGWYPCEDYPIWLNLLKKVIYKYNKDADIVFWTYNWSEQPKEARVKLIESLPEGISLLATFERSQPVKIGDSTLVTADYTLSFEGPSQSFVDEAIAAKKSGVRLYSMTNTAGLSWDIGVIPYEPMPYQWIRRYEEMRKATDNWGLCGIMESHHYGLYPSFISKLSKWAFYEPRESLEVVAERVLKSEFGEENFEKVDKALKLWSEAIRYYTPGDCDQYGSFRVGPSYPLCLFGPMPIPDDPKAHFGNSIVATGQTYVLTPLDTHLNLRLPEEVKSLKEMKRLMTEGIEILESVPVMNEKTENLLNLGKFIGITVQTGINSKIWHMKKCMLNAAETKEEITKILDELEEILIQEKENAQNAIPIVEADSRLGWEPSMLYLASEKQIKWKLKQTDYQINGCIRRHRKCLDI